MASEIDPTIFYCFIIEDTDPYKTSPFQGFSPGLISLQWPLELLKNLPADALEPALPHKATLARRIGGNGGWSWAPLLLKELGKISIAQTAPFWVIFSSTKAIAKAVTLWIESQNIHPLHVSPKPWKGTIPGDALDAEVVRRHIKTTLQTVLKQNATLDGNLIDQACAKWKNKTYVDAKFVKRGHNCTLPNHMVLETVGVRFLESEPLLGQTTEEYVSAIQETVDAIDRIRQDIGDVPGYRLTPPQPGLILTAPALYRHAYKGDLKISLADDSVDFQIVNKVMRFIQKQKTFQWSIENEELERLLASENAKAIIRMRQSELGIHTVAVGLRAASTLAAVIRLPPAVNRTANAVHQIATHTRMAKAAYPQKLARLFSVVQAALSDAVGPDFLQTISEAKDGIKLVTDAPLEWLPIGPLPLGLKFDCSRITATPGNLMVAELAQSGLLRLKSEAFNDILVISAFRDEDPLKRLIPATLDATEPKWRDKLTIRFAAVNNEAEFCNALNSYDGGILIFDGHGSHEEITGMGALSIGDDSINVWSLRGRVRVPPVVILSACDTQAVDRSHVTTANGFLAAGAYTVLGTLLPIDARHAAVFLGRLLLRLSDFISTAIKTRGRAIQWSEIAGGMLRMQLLTDLLHPYAAQKLLNQETFEHIHLQGNLAINSGHPNWFESVVGQTAEHLSLPPDQVTGQFQTLVPFSDTIRYVQTGNPETILVDDVSTMGHVEADLRLGNSKLVSGNEPANNK